MIICWRIDIRLDNRVHNIWYVHYSKLQLTFASPKWHLLELQLVAVTNDKLVVHVFAVFDLGFQSSLYTIIVIIWWLLITLAFSEELSELSLLPWLAMLYCCKMYSCLDMYERACTIDYVFSFINAGQDETV